MKRFKLIGSLASLALAFAVLGYGVYAASTATYSVTGSVSYTSTHVNATVTFNQFSSAASVKEVTKETTIADATYNTTAVKTDTQNFTNATADQATDNKETTGVSYPFNSGTSPILAYKNVITIKNNSDFAIVITQSITKSGNANWFSVVTKTDTELVSLAKGATTTITYYIGLKDASKTLADTPITISISMTKKA